MIKKSTLKDIINENKLVYVSGILLIGSRFIKQILFPKMYGDYIANISSNIININYSTNQ